MYQIIRTLYDADGYSQLELDDNIENQLPIRVKYWCMYVQFGNLQIAPILQ